MLADAEAIYIARRRASNPFGFPPSRRHDRMGGKAWTNQMLEENPALAIWITNSPRHLDPAYLRRFDYTIEVGHPPWSVRRQLLAQSCAELNVSAAWPDQATRTEGLTPAEIRRTARVARLLRNAGQGERYPDERTAGPDRELRRHPGLRHQFPRGARPGRAAAL